ncbi:type II 3-dehydroquinate dehydratase [Mesonia mobilis]|uniref:3-dehydroquinate dehydratase n=1 Tax=Mesonia mobilis TaxID=369791 RepID=A0ABQ3BNS8_9FLAO|nr:type II 3-dehydroquinate dehydratase [Mesonia mobilis]MBQ0738140.1 type II 3-dehydroquinate dehydratase [Aquimarina celericrescens]GGZ52210.1 3-dehydroquinate dehydratase [Mesonia mobilis]
MKILIINGPNLNLLGEREPEVYGKQTFNDYFTSLQFKLREVELSHFQSNHEGKIIDKLHEARLHFDGVVLNAAAYTHTSVAIADAVKAINIPVVEVHISNTSARENFRKHSYIAPYASGVITGFGMKSYELAVLSFVELPEKND